MVDETGSEQTASGRHRVVWCAPTLVAAGFLAGAAFGCGTEVDMPAPVDGPAVIVTSSETIISDAPPLDASAPCEITVRAFDVLAADHVPPCTPLQYEVFPPPGGTHFGVWADYRVYDSPVPWGYLVHSLEHGGVVIAYRCDEACDDLRQFAEGVALAQPDDPVCEGTGVPHRVIVVPEPALPVPLMALAWGYSYEATCTDEASLALFVSEHYGKAPENFCARGVDDTGRGWCE